MSTIKHINESEFENEVLKSDTPVLVDFYADWCGPCKMLAPEIEKLHEEVQGKITILKIDTDANNELAMKFQIMGVPTLILFKSGNEEKRMVGFKNLEELKRELQDYI